MGQKPPDDELAVVLSEVGRTGADASPVLVAVLAVVEAWLDVLVDEVEVEVVVVMVLVVCMVLA